MNFKAHSFVIAFVVMFSFCFGESALAQMRRTLPTSQELDQIESGVVPGTEEFTVTSKWLADESGCSQFSLDLRFVNPVTGLQENEVLKLYHPTQAGQGIPAVVIVPTIKGTTVIDKQAANAFCAKSMNAIVADVNAIEEPNPYPDWKKEERTLRRSLVVLQLAIDFAKNHPSMRARKVGVYGVSLGAITAAMLMGIDNRISAAVLVAGGANIPAILATTTNREMGTVRQKRLAHLDAKTPEKYFEQMDASLRLDPLFFKSHVDSKDILMVASSGDTQVNFASNEELRAHLGNPARLLYSSLDHVQMIVTFHWTQFARVTEWFTARL